MTGLLIIILAIAAVAWFWHEEGQQQPVENAPTRVEQSVSYPQALDLLKERYARGDIGREEYLEKKRDLEK